MAPKALIVLGPSALGAVLAGCGRDGECVLYPPCPLPIAITISVTAASGGPVPGVSVEISGAGTNFAQCDSGSTATTCVFPGTAGTYNMKVSAPGFETVTQTVTVQRTDPYPPCGCASVVTQHLDVVLRAAGSARFEG